MKRKTPGGTDPNGAGPTPEETEASKSGISGPPVVEEVPDPDKPKNLRERWKLIRNSVRGTFMALPRVGRLVWAASPAATIVPAVVTVIAGIIPAMTPYLAQLLLTAV